MRACLPIDAARSSDLLVSIIANSKRKTFSHVVNSLFYAPEATSSSFVKLAKKELGIYYECHHVAL